MEWSLTIVALALIAVATVSKRLSGSPITPAILFVSIGLLVGPKVLDGIDIESTSSTVRALAEATLALVLFSDASRIDLGALRREVSVPVRLLGIGLPLTIALGAVAAAVIFGELTFWEAAIVGIILAPTDAALGQAVVTEPRVPGRIRQGLNVESGLNDGICVPLLFAAVAAADVNPRSPGRTGITLLVEEVGYGIVGGVVAALLIGAVVIYAGRRDLIDGAWRQVIPAAGAALAYGTASALDGSGFIAAFVAGMVFQGGDQTGPRGDEPAHRRGRERAQRRHLRPLRRDPARPRARRAELGACAVRGSQPDGRRESPRRNCHARHHARLPTLGFMGWFGPRGLASIVFAVIVVEESQLPHEHLIVLAIYLTVGLSVFAHGISAAPLANRYADWFERHPSDKAPSMESSLG